MEPTRFTKGEFTGDLHVGGNLTVDGTYPSGGGSSLPADPGADGTYVLENTVSDGSGTLSWGSGGAGGGGLVVTMIEGDEETTLNKTWQEIFDAFSGGVPVVAVVPEGVGLYAYAVLTVGYDGADYSVELPGGLWFFASNASDYPAIPK